MTFVVLLIINNTTFLTWHWGLTVVAADLLCWADLSDCGLLPNNTSMWCSRLHKRKICDSFDVDILKIFLFSLYSFLAPSLTVNCKINTIIHHLWKGNRATSTCQRVWSLEAIFSRLKPHECQACCACWKHSLMRSIWGQLYSAIQLFASRMKMQ